MKVWKHRKRGTTYYEIGTAELQLSTGNPLREGAVLVIYKGSQGELWARPHEEFHDGRFEHISSIETKETTESSNNVNHPKHYGGEDNPYEVIKVLEAWMAPDEFEGFLKGNILKYHARSKMKGQEEDVNKAAWYNEYYVGFLKRRNPNK